MKLTGTIKSTLMDWENTRLEITFETEGVDAGALAIYENAKLLDIEVTKHSEKRTLNANAYFHLLSNKLADYIGVPKGRMKNYLLFEYGQRELDDDGNEMYLKVPESDLNWWLANEQIHMWSVNSDGDAALMVLLRHSADLNRDEFKVLLDGTIADCKECGIDTITPDEYAKMIAAMEGR